MIDGGHFSSDDQLFIGPVNLNNVSAADLYMAIVHLCENDKCVNFETVLAQLQINGVIKGNGSFTSDNEFINCLPWAMSPSKEVVTPDSYRQYIEEEFGEYSKEHDEAYIGKHLAR